MAEPVTASTANPAGVAAVLSDLGAAYIERLSSGDWARASVVLSSFAETFNQHRDALLAFMRMYSVSPNFSLIPARADATFTAATRRALQAVFVLDALPAEAIPLIERMPQVAEPAGITTWWREFQGYIRSRTRDFIAAISSDAVRTLAANIAARVNARIRGGIADVVRDTTATPFDTPSSMTAPTHPQSTPVPGTTILVAPSRWTMPTWGWWALGVGVLAAGGVVAYGAIERGWFEGKR